MEIFHRISFNASNKNSLLSWILDNGIKYKSIKLPLDGGLLTSFDFSETDPRWKELSKILDQIKAVDIIDTFFTEQEIRMAQFVRLIPVAEIGYPQPESTWSRDHQNYIGYCSKCGTYIDKENFRIRKNLTLEKRDFASLYWTYSLLSSKIVCNDFQEAGFKGFNCRDVFIHTTNLPSGIMELAISKTPQALLIDGELLNPKICDQCGTKKYLPHMKGVMKFNKRIFNMQYDLFQTHEWFGSGHAAYREVIISNRVANMILDKKWKGCRLKVVELC